MIGRSSETAGFGEQFDQVVGLGGEVGARAFAAREPFVQLLVGRGECVEPLGHRGERDAQLGEFVGEALQGRGGRIGR